MALLLSSFHVSLGVGVRHQRLCASAALLCVLIHGHVHCGDCQLRGSDLWLVNEIKFYGCIPSSCLTTLFQYPHQRSEWMLPVGKRDRTSANLQSDSAGSIGLRGYSGPRCGVGVRQSSKWRPPPRSRGFSHSSRAFRRRAALLPVCAAPHAVPASSGASFPPPVLAPLALFVSLASPTDAHLRLRGSS